MRLAVLQERRVGEERLEMDRADWPVKDVAAMKARNELAHRGDFIGDISAITHSESKGWPHVSKYKENFSKSYGIPFADAFDKAPLLPSHVVRMFDIRASINELHVWQRPNAQEKKKLISDVIEGFVGAVSSTSSEKLEQLFEDGKVWEEKADEVDRLFTARD